MATVLNDDDGHGRITDTFPSSCRCSNICTAFLGRFASALPSVGLTRVFFPLWISLSCTVGGLWCPDHFTYWDVFQGLPCCSVRQSLLVSLSDIPLYGRTTPHPSTRPSIHTPHLAGAEGRAGAVGGAEGERP